MKPLMVKIIIGLVILLGFGLTWNAFSPNAFKQWVTEQPTQVVKINCADLSLGCSFKIDQQVFEIKSLGTLNTSQPIELQLTGLAKKISLTWQMQGMEMSSNRYNMLSQNQKNWHAQTMLPICSQQRLDWLLTLHIDQTNVEIKTQSLAKK